MAVGKGSIQRAAKAVDAAAENPAKEMVETIVEKAPAGKEAPKKTAAKKTAPKKTPAKKTAAKKEPEKNQAVSIGSELPAYLL